MGENSRERIGRNLIEHHTSSYLTLISIVQGVALSFLAFVAVSEPGTLEFDDWGRAILTLLVLMLVWNEYVMKVATFEWVPNLIDSCIPFLFFSAELFTIQSIQEPRNWIFGMAATAGVAFLAILNMYLRAALIPANQSILTGLGKWRSVNLCLPVVAMIVFLTVWAMPRDIPTLPVAAVVILAYAIRTWFYWRQVNEYATLEGRDQ